MSEFIDELVIVNIVSRLPVESVLQCRCVCKRWRDVLHELHFTQIHTKRALEQQQVQQQQTVSLFYNVNFPKMDLYEFHVEDYHVNSESFPQIQPQLNHQQQQIVSFFMFVNIRYTNKYEFHLQDYYVNYADEQEYAAADNDDVVSPSSHKISRPLHPPPLIIFDDDDGKWKEDSYFKWFIIGSVNGLIGIYGDDRYDYCISPIIIIYNPITREYLSLPTDDRSLRVKDGRHRATGFGYNPNTNEYKIVRIIHQTASGKKYVRWIQIYTLGCGWRVIEAEETSYYFDSQGVPFNGAIYWIAVDTIVCFDMEDEKLRIIPSPPICSISYELIVLGKCLCLIEGNTCIWIMNNNNNNKTSTREYSKFYLPTQIWVKYYCQHQPIALTRRGRVLYLYSTRFLYAFDPWTYTLESLGPIPLCKGSFCIVSYTKSLVSLKALGEENAKIIGQQHATEEDAKKVIEQQVATEKKMTYPTKRKRSGSKDMKTQLIRLFTSLLLNLLVD